MAYPHRSFGPLSRSVFESGVYAASERPLRPEQGLVAQLAAVQARSTLRGMCEAGALVLRIRDAADGNHRPGVTAPTSFRQLARLPGMTMSSASLCRAVAIYELWQRMPELLECERIGVGHVSAVLCLKEDLQITLLKRAQDESWTKARLQKEVDQYRYRADQVRSVRPEID